MWENEPKHLINDLTGDCLFLKVDSMKPSDYVVKF